MSVDANWPTSDDVRLQFDVRRGNSTIWNIISSDYIPVNPSSNIRYEFTVDAEEVNGLHSKVYYFGEDKQPFWNDFVMGGIRGTLADSVSKTLPTPEGSAYIKLQFWIRPNPDQESSFSIHDVVLLSAGMERTETGRDERLTGEHPQGRELEETDRTQIGITINHGSSIGRTIDILKESEYNVAIQARFCDDCGSVIASIAGESKTFSLKAEDDETNWVTFSAFLLPPTELLKLTTIGKAEIDTVVLYSDSDSIESLDQLFNDQSSVAISEYDRVSPTKYVLTAYADRPFVLNLLRSYDPLWQVVIDGDTYSPVELFRQQNSFLIDRTGSLHIVIEYRPQEWFYIGSLVSLVFSLSALIYLIVRWRGLPIQAGRITKRLSAITKRKLRFNSRNSLPPDRMFSSENKR
jgi:hypothetical protein